MDSAVAKVLPLGTSNRLFSVLPALYLAPCYGTILSLRLVKQSQSNKETITNFKNFLSRKCLAMANRNFRLRGNWATCVRFLEP